MRKLARRLINERKPVRKMAITVSVHNAIIDRLWATAEADPIITDLRVAESARSRRSRPRAQSATLRYTAGRAGLCYHRMLVSSPPLSQSLGANRTPAIVPLDARKKPLRAGHEDCHDDL
jgi:hypothetical protein